VQQFYISLKLTTTIKKQETKDAKIMKILLLTISSLLISFHMIATPNEVLSDPLAKKAEAELYEVLKTQSEFVKVHAAEYLIWLGHVQKARAAFLEEEKLHHNVPKYRVVIWRVLTQTEKDAAGKKQWTDQVFKAFADEQGQDRIHAAETLGKLKLSPMAKYAAETNKILTTEKENLYIYTLWASAHASKTAYGTNKVKFLNLLYTSKIDDLKRISAFVLRREGKLTQSEWTTLAKAALDEPSTSPLKKTMLNTAFATSVTGPNAAALCAKVKEEMLKDYEQLPAGGRIELSLVLADHGAKKDLAVLADFLNDKYNEGFYDPSSALGADLRATAAYAILKIKQRSKKV
jgi:hypothetical protein